MYQKVIEGTKCNSKVQKSLVSTKSHSKIQKYPSTTYGNLPLYLRAHPSSIHTFHILFLNLVQEVDKKLLNNLRTLLMLSEYVFLFLQVHGILILMELKGGSK